jgi:DNA-binding CsgD family transcriptional regulator
MSSSAVPAVVPLPAEPRRLASDASSARWERWIPDWVRRIGAAVWVTGPGGRIVHVNARAEALLGVAAREAVGLPCHAVVGARTASGAAFCGARCPLNAAADAGDEVPPADVRIGGRGGRAPHWIEMTVIPVEGPDRTGRWMVHVVRVADRARRIERYVARVARRSEEIREAVGVAAPRDLSPREAEILDLLAEDEDPSRIAARLGLSYVTVRNHVQHAIAKLGAHSAAEAVAMRLLAAD